MTENGQRSAAAFRRSVETVTLPSGKEVDLVRPDVSALIMANVDSGDVPKPLVDQMLMSISNQRPVAAQIDLEAAHLPGMYRFMRIIARAALVWPRVVDDEIAPDYEAGEIHLGDLDTSDLTFITNWVWGRAGTAAGRFPEPAGKGVDAAPDVQAIPAAAKPRTRSRK